VSVNALAKALDVPESRINGIVIFIASTIKKLLIQAHDDEFSWANDRDAYLDDHSACKYVLSRHGRAKPDVNEECLIWLVALQCTTPPKPQQIALKHGLDL